MPSGRPDPAAQIVFDAYQRTTGPVAFLDESYQASDGVTAHRDTFYVFTAVIVELDAMDELRVGTEDIAGGTYRHTTKGAANFIWNRPDPRHARLPRRWARSMCDRAPNPCRSRRHRRSDRADRLLSPACDRGGRRFRRRSMSWQANAI